MLLFRLVCLKEEKFQKQDLKIENQSETKETLKEKEERVAMNVKPEMILVAGNSHPELAALIAA